MKTVFIIIASLCCTIGYSQEKNSTRKDFKPVENTEVLKAQMKKDSLNGIKSISTKKLLVISSEDNNPAETTIDTTHNSKAVPLNSSKKKL